jgi:ribosome biogenesis protein UTP30
MEEEEIVENVMAAVDGAAEKVPKKWANVRALHLKAVDSVALPIYHVVPELGMKIEVPVARLEGELGSGEVIDAAEVETLGKKIDKKKKALRHADANDEAGVANEESAKRKRNRKEQIEDAVMQEGVQAEIKKKRRKSFVIPVDEEQKVGKKGEEKKGKRDFESEMEEASIGIKSKKDKIEERKKKKKSVMGGGDYGEVLGVRTRLRT